MILKPTGNMIWVPQLKPWSLKTWWSKVVLKKRCNIFKFDLKEPLEKGVIWVNLISHHYAKFVGDRSCGRGDRTYLICNMTWCDHKIKGHINFQKGTSDPSYQCTKFDAYRSCEKRHKIVLIRHMASLDPMIKGIHDLLVGVHHPKSLPYQVKHF